MTLSPIGIILSGGRSTRFGADKASADIDGQTSLSRVQATLRLVVDEVVIVGGPHGALADLEPNGGPVQALATAALAYPARSLLVVACDVPLVPQQVLVRLATQSGSHHDALIARLDARPQPLLARYDAGGKAALVAAHEAGERRLMRVVDGLECGWLDLDTLPEGMRARCRDFDTPQDHAALIASLADTP